MVHLHKIKLYPEGNDELYQVFEDGGRSHVIMPFETRLDGCRKLAEAALELGQTALFRVFRVKSIRRDDSGKLMPDQVEFVLSYSVIHARITELGTPVIPREFQVEADRSDLEKLALSGPGEST